MSDFFICNIKTIDEIYVIKHNLTNLYSKQGVKIIDNTNDLSQILDQSLNLSLFTSSNLSNQNIEHLILYKLDITPNILNKLKLADKYKFIILANCKIPQNYKFKAIPNNLLKAPNINYAKKVLSKYLTYNEIENIISNITLPNSDYYIDIIALNTLIQQLEFIKDFPELKSSILENYTNWNENIFKAIEYLLNNNLNKSTQYFEKLLKANNISNILGILISNLIDIFLLKTQDTQALKTLKKNNFYLKKLEQISKNVSLQTIYTVLFKVIKFNNDIKSGKYINPNQAWLLFIIKINTIIQHN